MTDISPIYAHSLAAPFPQSQWETLEEHQQRVAELAEQFASAFGAGEWGRPGGLWHDLGKVQPDFQSYIRGLRSDGPPHAWVGALLAAHLEGKALLPLVFAIASHHSGLGDLRRTSESGFVDGPTPLRDLIEQHRSEFGKIGHLIPENLKKVSLPRLPEYILKSTDLLSMELFIRMLSSALVDADRIATAGFYARTTPALTAEDFHYDSIATLKARLDKAIDAMPSKGSPAVTQLRREVLQACRAHADDPCGQFSLTVPTGGGKTLSAMSFALRHAQRHQLRRIIVVIPYTSIIEQSARVYQQVLNDPAMPNINNVLEHHTNLDEQKRAENNAYLESLRQLAAENWDAPVIVTTTVQFFESLLSNHPSRYRKLHNIARSVILLDEVQTLPPKFLRTIVEVLNQLTNHYGCSVVLSTATPPALAARPDANRPGLEAKEIIADPSDMAKRSRRVKIEWRIDRPTPYKELANELSALQQALVVVHRRDDAQLLATLLADQALHLSAAMCPAHRLQVLEIVRKRLANDQSCLLVSTQLIEAGVDVDFPVVYRALAGLDSIAQAAGRCDREGKLTADNGRSPGGRMVVFRAETDPPPGIPEKAIDSMKTLLGQSQVNPFDPRDSLRFFSELYRKIDEDQHRIELLRKELMFAQVSAQFRLIDAAMCPVVVRWGEGAQRLDTFRANPTRHTRRALQPFSVQVHQFALKQLRSAGIVSVDESGAFDMVNEGFDKAYDERYGLLKVGSDIIPTTI